MKRQDIRKAMLSGAFILFEYRVFHLFFSPVLVVMAASKGIVNGSLIMYAGLFLTSLVFGRAWCGWMCPGAAINEACSVIVSRRPKRGNARAIKYVLFALMAGTIGLLTFRAGGFHSVQPFFGMDRESFLLDLILLFGAILIIVPVSFLWGKRAFCHYLCWQAPILVIGNRLREYARWSSLHLAVTGDACDECGACDRHCPMSLRVTELVKTGTIRNTECILCGNCVDWCPKGMIRFSWSRKQNK